MSQNARDASGSRLAPMCRSVAIANETDPAFCDRSAAERLTRPWGRRCWVGGRTMDAEVREVAMRVWIDQDCCTGAGLCVDHCPELFVVLEDGIGYVRDGPVVISDTTSVPVPRRYAQAAIDAVERCPGECIYLDPDQEPPAARESDIIDAEVVNR
jgi:ferredoxin